MKSASSSRDQLDNIDSSGSKLGPMMLATLHGLTRSRPDLLLESMTTFSAFTTPSRMPKEEIGAYLEAKIAEGEVLREFERIPKKKLSSDAKTMFKTATMAENVPRNRFKDVLPYDENRVRLAGGDKVIIPFSHFHEWKLINKEHILNFINFLQTTVCWSDKCFLNSEFRMIFNSCAIN